MEYRPLETDLRITSSGLGACQHLAFNAEMMGERVEGETAIANHVPVLFIAHHEVVKGGEHVRAPVLVKALLDQYRVRGDVALVNGFGAPRGVLGCLPWSCRWPASLPCAVRGGDGAAVLTDNIGVLDSRVVLLGTDYPGELQPADEG